MVLFGDEKLKPEGWAVFLASREDVASVQYKEQRESSKLLANPITRLVVVFLIHQTLYEAGEFSLK
jgi:hypothetical protein